MNEKGVGSIPNCSKNIIKVLTSLFVKVPVYWYPECKRVYNILGVISVYVYMCAFFSF